MIGRKIAVAVLTGAIVLTPVVAMAATYPAPPRPPAAPPAPSPSESVLPTASTSPSPDPTTSTATVAKTTGAVPTLSTTGFESMPLALGAGALLAVGAATVIVAARRTSGTES